ncbi:hypothetical protein HPB49_005820 [Dermacentor silvarum]|uniref:Uncharacterized protein n=1 Tax=Dermacentor silvarum TaxID=543639 RepID=A0ACB8DVK6_DERSI|nr:hypothetical protein HPB49_005820 [Dermacentor silvarum]
MISKSKPAKYTEDKEAKQEKGYSYFSSSPEQLSRLEAILPGVNFADYVSTDARADMDATEHFGNEDPGKLPGDAEQVSKADGADTNVDRALTSSEVMDPVNLLRRFAGSQERKACAVIALGSYKSYVTPLLEN